MILIGDTVHNFVDGILIAAAFLADIQLGIVTAIAMIAHEIPQEVGDFLILLHSGFTRAQAIAYNLLSSLATLVGGLLAYLALSRLQGLVPPLLGIAAASMLYVSVADLIPGLHKRPELRATVQQLALIGARHRLHLARRRAVQRSLIVARRFTGFSVLPALACSIASRLRRRLRLLPPVTMIELPPAAPRTGRRSRTPPPRCSPRTPSEARRRANRWRRCTSLKLQRGLCLTWARGNFRIAKPHSRPDSRQTKEGRKYGCANRKHHQRLQPDAVDH